MRFFLRILAPVIFLAQAVFNQACDPGICAANSNVLDDSDADCIPDEQDNCVLEGNPEGSYNPEQFDGNENNVGQPCDTVDSVSEDLVTSAAYWESRFNMAGDYELFFSSCPGQTGLAVEQDHERVRATAFGRTFSGTAILSDDGLAIAAFARGETFSCVMDIAVPDNVLELSCYDYATGTACRALGEKTLTRLWTDLPDADSAPAILPDRSGLYVSASNGCPGGAALLSFGAAGLSGDGLVVAESRTLADGSVLFRADFDAGLGCAGFMAEAPGMTFICSTTGLPTSEPCAITYEK